MNGIWNGLGEAQSAAIAASGSANALYFARRVATSIGARRIAAAVLAGIFGGVALDAVGGLGGGASEAVEVAQRAPLLIATLATNALLAIGARR
ncbi:MAG: hypothetical protein DWI58_09100 [Chloroflexi bacterium]|nr:MAG: hypothetical protein DWI58_09100 [Chloroflexota bacterium]